jgi:hypothetical protein
LAKRAFHRSRFRELQTSVVFQLITSAGRVTDQGCAHATQPTAFLKLHTDDHADPSCRIKIQHGTTTLAFRFRGGIVVAVDSRATAGSYIGELHPLTFMP